MKWRPSIWRTVPGARRYAVSDDGLIRNSSGLLKSKANAEGYPKINLIGDDGRRRSHFVHKLVALAHLAPALPGQRYVLHRNNNRQDARASNLRWGSHADNHSDKLAAGTVRAVTRKLKPSDVRRIRGSRRSPEVLAAKYGLSLSHVRDIRSGRRWKRV